MRVVADQIRGKGVEEAPALLRFSPRGASVHVLKLVESAAANAENNHDLDPEEMLISEISVDEGPTMRRYRPRARGRATRSTSAPATSRWRSPRLWRTTRAMGQKINPEGFRVGYIHDWKSNWFDARNFSDALIEDIKIRDHIENKLAHAGLSDIEIKKQRGEVTVDIHTARPGIVIGKSGSEVDALRKELHKISGKPVRVNIREIKRPELDAKLVAQSIAEQLENRVAFRRAMKRALTSAMRSGAKGVKVQVSGRLGGAEMARTQMYADGSVPLHTLRADIDYGFIEARTTTGRIGVKCWINKGEVMPEGFGAGPDEDLGGRGRRPAGGRGRPGASGPPGGPGGPGGGGPQRGGNKPPAPKPAPAKPEAPKPAPAAAPAAAQADAPKPDAPKPAEAPKKQEEPAKPAAAAEAPAPAAPEQPQAEAPAPEQPTLPPRTRRRPLSRPPLPRRTPRRPPPLRARPRRSRAPRVVIPDADAEAGQAPQAAPGQDARLLARRHRGPFRRVRAEDARARLDHEPPDRGRPRGDDPQDQAWRQGLDHDLPRQAVHQEAGRDPDGQGQGQPGGLGRRGQARADHVRALRRRRGPRPRGDGARRPQASREDEVHPQGGLVKSSDVHALGDNELVQKLQDAREEAFNLRLKHATGELEDSARLPATRRDVARLLTVARERGIDLEKELKD